VFVAPHLGELILDGTEDEFVHFLSQLEAARLHTFEANLEQKFFDDAGWDDSDDAVTDWGVDADAHSEVEDDELKVWDREKTLQILATKSFVSVRDAKLTSNGERPFLHLRVFPNLHKLRICISKRTNDDTVLAWPKPYKGITGLKPPPILISDIMNPLRDILTSNFTGTLLFSHLRSIVAHCSVEHKQPTESSDDGVHTMLTSRAPAPMDADCNVVGNEDMQPTQWSQDAKEEVHRVIQEMLISRTKAGGLALQMEPLGFYISNSKVSKWKTTTVVLEARAAPSPPEPLLVESGSFADHSFDQY